MSSAHAPGTSRASWLLLVLLVMAVFVSALAVVHSTDRNRGAWNRLQALKTEKQQLQVEWGQLLLQQSTLTTPVRIEQLAVSRLAMKVPQLDEIVVIQR